MISDSAQIQRQMNQANGRALKSVFVFTFKVMSDSSDEENDEDSKPKEDVRSDSPPPPQVSRSNVLFIARVKHESV